MTYIDPASALRGEVVRRISTYNDRGAVIETTREPVVGIHWVDLQPLEVDDRVASEQNQFAATHEIYPGPDVMANVVAGDFYRIAGREYKIIEPQDFRELGCFRVIEEP